MSLHLSKCHIVGNLMHWPINYLLNYKVNPQLLIQDFSHANKMLNKAAVNAGSNEMLTFSMGHPEGVTTKKKYFPL